MIERVAVVDFDSETSVVAVGCVVKWRLEVVQWMQMEQLHALAADYDVLVQYLQLR